MMWQRAKSWQYSETKKFQFLTLPYNFSEISMKIILPKERYGLDDVIKTLTLAELSKHLSKEERKQVIVKIPRFEVNANFDAVQTLKNIGIHELFGPEANLEGITKNNGISVSSILHTAFIYVSLH